MSETTTETAKDAGINAITFATSEANFSVSFKTQRGTLLTFRGVNAAEVADNILAAQEPATEDGDSLLDVIAQIDAKLGAGAGTGGGGSAPPQRSISNPCPECGGETEFREGTSKAGRAYKGYFCLVSRDHKPTFIR